MTYNQPIAPQVPVEGPTPSSGGIEGDDGNMNVGETVPMVAAPNTPGTTMAPQPMDQIAQPGDNAYAGGPLSTASIADPYEEVPAGVDRDAGSDNTIEGAVDSAVSDANARRGELEGDTMPVGGTIGDLMDLPDTPSDLGKMTGGSGDYHLNS